MSLAFLLDIYKKDRKLHVPDNAGRKMCFSAQIGKS